MNNRYWMISFHKNTRNLTVRSVPKKDIAHNIELIIRPLNIPIESKRKLTAVCSHQTRIGNLDAHLI